MTYKEWLHCRISGKLTFVPHDDMLMKTFEHEAEEISKYISRPLLTNSEGRKYITLHIQGRSALFRQLISDTGKIINYVTYLNI